MQTAGATTLDGGRIAERERGRFEITRVPSILKERDRLIGRSDPVLDRYGRVTFDKAMISGQPQAELLAPGHPLPRVPKGGAALIRSRPLAAMAEVLRGVRCRTRCSLPIFELIARPRRNCGVLPRSASSNITARRSTLRNEPQEHVERKLAAILAADVVGYIRLMGLDEEGTLERLKEHRRALFDPKIIEHRGRIVKTIGDGLLVEFASVVDAVRCAVDVQRGMAERNTESLADRRIDFRIGINVGDIIIDGDDIYGDGVNVAARLEGLAEPGGIYVSRVVRDQVRDKLDFGFEDMGAQSVKNIARPVRVHRVQLAERPSVSIAVDRKSGRGAPSLGKAFGAVFRLSWRLARAVLMLVIVLIVLYRWVMPPITPYMLLRLPEAGKIEQRTVPLGAISPDLPRALIASGDHHFCLHKGVDWDAAPVNGLLSNANSITMQLAGNLFLWPGDGLLRRGLTIGLAYAIDLVWPKPRILEVYLNIAEWGPGVYGVGAAADVFFHKNAAQLSRNEDALLVAVLQDPWQMSPGQPTRDVTARAAWVAQKIDQRRGSYGCL